MTAVAVDSLSPLVDVDPQTPLEHPRQFWSTFGFGNDSTLPIRRSPTRATKLTAPLGPHASSITKLSNCFHKEVLYDEVHDIVACLESLKDEFRLLTLATTAQCHGLRKSFFNSLYAQEVDVIRVKGVE